MKQGGREGGRPKMKHEKSKKKTVSGVLSHDFGRRFFGPSEATTACSSPPQEEQRTIKEKGKYQRILLIFTPRPSRLPCPIRWWWRRRRRWCRCSSSPSAQTQTRTLPDVRAVGSRYNAGGDAAFEACAGCGPARRRWSTSRRGAVTTRCGPSSDPARRRRAPCCRSAAAGGRRRS